MLLTYGLLNDSRMAEIIPVVVCNLYLGRKEGVRISLVVKLQKLRQIVQGSGNMIPGDSPQSSFDLYIARLKFKKAEKHQ